MFKKMLKPFQNKSLKLKVFYESLSASPNCCRVGEEGEGTEQGPEKILNTLFQNKKQCFSLPN